MKRLLSIFLAILTCISVLSITSCFFGQNAVVITHTTADESYDYLESSQNPDSTTPPDSSDLTTDYPSSAPIPNSTSSTTADYVTTDDITCVYPAEPDLDFQGITVGIACRPETRYAREFGVVSPASPLDMKVYLRNKQTEKELNVKIKVIQESSMWMAADIQAYVVQNYQAGSARNADVICAYAKYSIVPEIRGYYVNLLDGQYNRHLNISNRYWNQSYVKSAAAYDQLYYIVGELNLSVYDKSVAVFTNMDLASKNGIAPHLLYSAVHDGEWTYDYMYRIINDFEYIDVNETSSVDVGDIVPLASVNGAESADTFLSAWDIELLTADDDLHTVVIDGNVKLEAAAAKLKALYDLDGVYLTDVANSFDKTFLGGKGLFDIDVLYRNESSNRELRKCGFDFAILPLPKYDSEQKEYNTTPIDSYNTMSVLNYQKDRVDAACATLELMCYKTNSNVRAFYSEMLICGEYISDSDNVKMIDIILDGITFNKATVYSTVLEGLPNILHNAIANNQTIAEIWAEDRQPAIDAVRAFNMLYEAMQY
ncbi:MAG: hypothetical protein E7607_02300 [Ruminococcaceae bacterium]|nr:hypothetical protein [Oscillospiraceae bacterium]